jgi:hypothetical protein
MVHSLPAEEPQLPHNPQFTVPPEAPLKMSFVMQQVQQQLLSGQEPMAMLVDTGDSMFRWEQVHRLLRRQQLCSEAYGFRP